MHGRGPSKRLLSGEAAAGLDLRSSLALYAQYINPLTVHGVAAFNLARKYVRAEGIHLWDDAGNRYYDFFNAFGCLNLGHNHPKILRAVRQALDEHAPMLHQLSPSSAQAALAYDLAAVLPSPLSVSYFVNSGAEAVEASMKLARAATGRKPLLSATNSYHGSTLGALSLTGISKYRNPFKPLIPLVDQVPYGDIDEIRKALRTTQYAGVFLEPIQGQGGIVVAPPDYLRDVRSLCDRFGTLLVLDEAQTGLGRTGALFCFNHFGIVPDVLVLSKSLGGGVMPLSACITTQALWKKAYGSFSRFHLHSSTFSGNHLACVCGIATLEALAEEQLPQNSRVMGEYFLNALEQLKHKNDCISEIRGLGLMIGIKFEMGDSRLLNNLSHELINVLSPKLVTSYIASRLLNEHAIIVSPSLGDEYILRIYPPLNVSKEDIDYFVNSLHAVCASLGDYIGLLKQTTVRFGRYYLSTLGRTP
jgi:putrescine aminotransferase